MRGPDFMRQLNDERLGMVHDLKPGSRRMVVTFAAFPGSLRVRPFAFATMLQDVPVKAAFLRDHTEAWYHRGVAGVGGDVDAVVAHLRELSRNAEEVVLLGTSSGGYAALLFGALLGVEAHAFSPQTFIDPDLRREHHDTRFQMEFAGLGEDLDRRYADLRPVLAASQGRFHIYYARGHRLDALHAERVGDLPQVTLHGFDWESHLLVRELRDRGWLEPFLLDLSGGRE